jgi:arylformamidase
MTTDWIDISVPLRSGLLTWPDDPAARITRIQDLSNGDACTVSHLAMSAHTGTHVDAPAHYLAGGATLDDMPHDATVGPACVVAVPDAAAIGAGTLADLGLHRGDRVLFRTRNSERRWSERAFDERYVALSPEAARLLVEVGARAVGVDGPSVDAWHGGDAVHRILLGAGIWIIEGLDLASATPGRYELLCLPLRIADAEGAPARALLRPLAGGEA